MVSTCNKNLNDLALLSIRYTERIVDHIGIPIFDYRTILELQKALNEISEWYKYFTLNEPSREPSSSAIILRRALSIERNPTKLIKVMDKPSYTRIISLISCHIGEVVTETVINEHLQKILEAIHIIKVQHTDRLNASEVYNLKNNQVTRVSVKNKGDSEWRWLLVRLTFVFEQFFESEEKSIYRDETELKEDPRFTMSNIFKSSHKGKVGAYFRFMEMCVFIIDSETCLSEEYLATFIKRESRKYNTRKKQWNFEANIVTGIKTVI